MGKKNPTKFAAKKERESARLAISQPCQTDVVEYNCQRHAAGLKSRCGNCARCKEIEKSSHKDRKMFIYTKYDESTDKKLAGPRVPGGGRPDRGREWNLRAGAASRASANSGTGAQVWNPSIPGRGVSQIKKLSPKCNGGCLPGCVCGKYDPETFTRDEVSVVYYEDTSPLRIFNETGVRLTKMGTDAQVRIRDEERVSGWAISTNNCHNMSYITDMIDSSLIRTGRTKGSPLASACEPFVRHPMVKELEIALGPVDFEN
jgi:hypothetical protein